LDFDDIKVSNSAYIGPLSGSPPTYLPIRLSATP